MGGDRIAHRVSAARMSDVSGALRTTGADVTRARSPA